MESNAAENTAPEKVPEEEVKQETTENKEMLNVDEGPEMPKDAGSEQKDEKPKGKPHMIKQEKLYEVMKALTAMKLVKEDPTPGEVLPYLYIGGIGTAYNKEAM